MDNIHKLSNSLDAVKEKLTDMEYKEMMDTLGVMAKAEPKQTQTFCVRVLAPKSRKWNPYRDSPPRHKQMIIEWELVDSIVRLTDEQMRMGGWFEMALKMRVFHCSFFKEYNTSCIEVDDVIFPDLPIVKITHIYTGANL